MGNIPSSEFGKGYGQQDMQWLYKRYLLFKETIPNRPMTDAEINKLLDELDKARGTTPAWRL